MPAALEAEQSALKAALKGGASPGKAAFARRFSAAADLGDDMGMAAAEVRGGVGVWGGVYGRGH